MGLNQPPLPNLFTLLRMVSVPWGWMFFTVKNGQECGTCLLISLSQLNDSRRLIPANLESVALHDALHNSTHRLGDAQLDDRLVQRELWVSDQEKAEFSAAPPSKCPMLLLVAARINGCDSLRPRGKKARAPQMSGRWFRDISKYS